MGVLGEEGRDKRLWCQFYHPNIKPTNIVLPLGVSGVTWEYSLNTNVTDTYGGQVIQILGVTINNLTIKGNFGGPDPQWGAEQEKDGSYRVLNANNDPNPRFGQYNWINDFHKQPWANGLRQMADWFRAYFELTTQGGPSRKGDFQSYNQQKMKFSYPGRGWEFFIRPTSFPSVKMSNDNIAPEWTVEADFVEEYETSRKFVTDVEKVALDRLNDLKENIGFKRRNPFSEFVGQDVTSLDAATKIVETYQDSVMQGLSEEELEELVSFGFSFPGSVYKRAGLTGSVTGDKGNDS